MPLSIDLSGKSALVTGASQGIGEAIARTLHAAGAKVALNHPDLPGTKAAAEAIAAQLESERLGSTIVLAADVTNPPAIQEMFATLKSHWAGLDFLVNNAGILRDRSVAKMSLDEWNAVIATNLTGVFHCAKFGLEIMNDGGAIVSLGSIAADAGFHGQANYAAAKAGVQALTRVLARECAKRKIRANAVAPGVVDTPMFAQVAPEVRARYEDAIPLKRLAQPQEIANAVLFLCSPLASYITGHTLGVNGGWRG
jgi:3-oxoacyl-[acyl-carrier protein] reductase